MLALTLTGAAKQTISFTTNHEESTDVCGTPESSVPTPTHCESLSSITFAIKDQQDYEKHESVILMRSATIFDISCIEDDTHAAVLIMMLYHAESEGKAPCHETGPHLWWAPLLPSWPVL